MWVANDILIGGMAALEFSSTASLWAEVRRRDKAGLSVVIVSSESGLSAATCDAFNARSDVRSAGGFRDAGIDYLGTSPSIRFPTAEFTSGLLPIWDPSSSISTSRSTGIVLGRALADDTGATTGTLLEPARLGLVQVGKILATTNRNELQAGWLLMATAPVGMIDECWIEWESGQEGPGRALATAAFAGAMGEISVHSLVALGDHARSLADEFSQRPGKALLPIAGLLAAVVLCLLTWFRRAELALYRAVGTSRRELWLLCYMDTTILLLVGGFLGLLWASCASQWSRTMAEVPVPGAVGASVVVRTTALALASVVLLGSLSFLLVRTDVSRDLKDR